MSTEKYTHRPVRAVNNEEWFLTIKGSVPIAAGRAPVAMMDATCDMVWSFRVVNPGLEKMVADLRKIHSDIWVGVPGNIWAMNKEGTLVASLTKGEGKEWVVDFAPETFTPWPMRYSFKTLVEAFTKLIDVTLAEVQQEWKLNHDPDRVNTTKVRAY